MRTATSSAHPRVRLAAEVVVSTLAAVVLVWAWRADERWFQLHMLPHYCELEAKDHTRWLEWRWAALAIGVLLATVVRSRLGRWAGARTAGAALGSVARVVIPLVAALGVSEIWLRRTWPFRHDDGVSFPLPPCDGDGRLGWKHRPSTTTHILEDGRDVVYAYEAHGWRVRDQNDALDPDRPTLLFAGESITAGLGVPYEETFPAIIGQRLGMQVLVAAVHGYGHDQQYLRMLDALAWLHHPAAVVTTEFTVQLERDMKFWRPALRLDDHGALHVVPADSEPLAKWGLRELWMRVVPYHGDDAYEIARAIFVDTARQVRARGAYPLVVSTNYLTPCFPDEDGKVPAEERFLAGVDGDVLHVAIDPTWLVKTNQHPDARAHRVLPDSIEGALRRAGVGR